MLKERIRGKDLNIWISGGAIDCLVEFLDPFENSKHNSDKIDYSLMLFILERPALLQQSKTTQIPSLAFVHSLLDSIYDYT